MVLKKSGSDFLMIIYTMSDEYKSILLLVFLKILLNYKNSHSTFFSSGFSSSRLYLGEIIPYQEIIPY